MVSLKRHFSCRPHVAQMFSSVDIRFIERLIKWVSKPDPLHRYLFLSSPSFDVPKVMVPIQAPDPVHVCCSRVRRRSHVRLALAKFESCSVVFVCSLRSVQGTAQRTRWRRFGLEASAATLFGGCPGNHGPTFLRCFETPR